MNYHCPYWRCWCVKDCRRQADITSLYMMLGKLMSLAHQMYSLVQGWQVGFITPPNTDQMVVSLFCIFLQRILRLSLESQKTKMLHQLSFSTLGRNVSNSSLSLPSVCQFWFLWEDETNFTETISKPTQTQTGHTVACCTLKVWWVRPMVILNAPPHLRCSHLV